MGKTSSDILCPEIKSLVSSSLEAGERIFMGVNTGRANLGGLGVRIDHLLHARTRAREKGQLLGIDLRIVDMFALTDVLQAYGLEPVINQLVANSFVYSHPWEILLDPHTLGIVLQNLVAAAGDIN